MAASIWNPGSNSVPSLPPVTPVAFIKGTAGAPGITFSGDTETGIWSEADGYLQFTSNGTTRIQIAPDGTVSFGGTFTSAPEVSLASAATVDLGGQGTNSLNITGDISITSFGTAYRGPIFARLSGNLTLVNSATLRVPGASNLALSAGSCFIAIPKYTSTTPDGWQIVSYQNASGSSGGGTTGGGGAVGAGSDQIFYQNDTVMTGNWEVGQDALAACTISIAAPAVVSQVHTYLAGTKIRFTTTANLPAGVVANQVYYVISAGLTTSAFQFSLTLGGTAVTTTGSQSGTQKCGSVKNASVTGLLTINPGILLTTPVGSRLVIL
jgi:hypothetical protein